MNLSGTFACISESSLLSNAKDQMRDGLQVFGVFSDIIIGKSDVLNPSITRQITTRGTEAAIDRLFEVYFDFFYTVLA